MTEDLKDKAVLVVGGRSGIARRIAADVVAAGGHAIIAGRNPEKVDAPPGVRTLRLDLADEASISSAAADVGELDHVIVLAADHANGPLGELSADAVRAAFDAKVVGPLLVAKHLAPTLRAGGSFLFFSGVAAWKPAPGLAVMATTNGAVAFLAQALAVELAPLRVNALSPGIIDSGAWDGMGAGKDELFRKTAAANPVGRVGTVADVSQAALATLSNGFVTGTVVHVDGGGRLT